MNLLSFYLCSEENVFFWKSQNSCNGIFLLTWSRLFSNHDSNYVGICHVPLWIKRAVFPIRVNFSITSRCILKATFSITSRCVLKATIQSRKQWTVLSYLRQFFFFFKKMLLWCCICMCCIWIIFLFYHNLFLFPMFLSFSIIFAISRSRQAVL